MSGPTSPVSICHACQTPASNAVRAVNGELYHLECNPFGDTHTRGRKSAETGDETLVEETRPRYALAEPSALEGAEAELPRVESEKTTEPRSEDGKTSPKLVD